MNNINWDKYMTDHHIKIMSTEEAIKANEELKNRQKQIDDELKKAKKSYKEYKKHASET